MSEEHKEATRKLIPVMQAYLEGQPIEYKPPYHGEWCRVFTPAWSTNGLFRIATIPDSIDWSHVVPEWKYMARDEDGQAYFYEAKPVCKGSYWQSVGDYRSVCDFASFKRGTVDHKDSLVIRPEN